MSLKETELCLAVQILRWILVGMASVGFWPMVVYVYRYTFGG
ncbi:hypothetical protein [Turicimonas muris]|nr:hypothetical protein [Turicimonas muris]